MRVLSKSSRIYIVFSLVTTLVMFLGTNVIAAVPVGVEIKPMSGDGSGNVVVTLSDHSRQQLTTRGNCKAPKIGPAGLVGWTWASERYKGDWVNNHLRVQNATAVVIDVVAALPFIEGWGFSDRGVVIKSRALHGAPSIELFSLYDGKKIASFDDFKDAPSWALPYLDPL